MTSFSRIERLYIKSRIRIVAAKLGVDHGSRLLTNEQDQK
jgi:hypothetical protein